MKRRMLSGWFTGACVLLVLATPQVARAHVPVGGPLVWKNLDKNASKGTPTTMSTADKTRRLPHGRLENGPGPESVPNDDASAPVPEPGTLTLASFGLLALGAAIRKRRVGHTSASEGQRIDP